MLKINRKLSQKGFSLIELMIAITILALAIFGIFHAYSVGFLGMADARDRTVATNYAREAMEDIKNTDFDQIITQPRAFVSGTKYEREVIVQPSTNLKKVTTKVYWKDRNDNTKIVETDMLIHFIETTAGAPSKIILYANPYNVLTQDVTDHPDDPENTIDERKSTITAVVKDDKGNTVTGEIVNISFSITTGSLLGGISSVNEDSDEGKATTIFTASDVGEVVITATATGLTSSSVTINITDPEEPVKINLTADTYFMTPDTSSTSLITAKIFNAGNELVESAMNEITFTVTGPGTLSTPTTKPAVNGEATITLSSDGTPGTITVTASSSGLVPDFVTVITGGKISLSASSINVPINETSEITVTTKDVNGVPMKYIGTIDLTVDEDGFGYLSPSSVTFDGTTSSETVIFTASGIGEVIITSEDVSVLGILTPENYLILTVILALNPDHIKVSAVPLSIPIGGNDTSTITARVEDEYYIPITSYTELITFTTDKGHFPNNSQVINTNHDSVTYENGVATVELSSYPSDSTGIANISVTSVYYGETISGNTRVGFYLEVDHIDLITIPQSILTGGGSEGTCIIIATIKDGAVVVSGYNGTVTFYIEEGYPSGVKFTSTNQGSITISVVDGTATIDLQSKNWVGTAKIKATASDGISDDLESYLFIPVVENKNLEIFLLYRKIDEFDDAVDFMNYYNPEGVFQDNWNQADIIYGKFCVDSDNNLYILDIDINSNCLKKINNRGELSSLLRSDEIVKIEDRYNIDDSYAINIGPNGYVYFTQDIGDTEIPEYYIKKINPNTLVVEDILNLTYGVPYGGLAIDSDGVNIYIHNLSDPTQTIEKWNFIEGFTGSSIDLSSNYEFSELAIAGESIGGVGEVTVEEVVERKAFTIPKDLNSSETTLTLTGMVNPLYISSIGGDFLFSGLEDDGDKIVFGRYGTDDSLKWSHIIIKEDDIPFSDCIIGAYPF